MKKLLYLSLALLLFASCEKEKEEELIEPGWCGTGETHVYSNITLYKINYTDYAFEGTYDLNFYKSIEEVYSDIPVSVDYQSPGDFGHVKIFYAPNEELIFDGGIHWMGLGEQHFPNNLLPAEQFNNDYEAAPMPDVNQFQLIAQEAWFVSYEELDLNAIWNSVSTSNALNGRFDPNVKYGIFLYTPSVGIGNPEDWDYYLFTMTETIAISCCG